MIISGGLQIFLDFFVLMQIYCYKSKNKLKQKEIDANNESSVEIVSNAKSRQVQEINQFMNF